MNTFEKYFSTFLFILVTCIMNSVKMVKNLINTHPSMTVFLSLTHTLVYWFHSQTFIGILCEGEACSN